jgi:hypothetical protein
MTNVTTLTPSEQLVVTAVVTDPQGIAQVVGGTLSDPGGASYGAFEVSTVSGAYSLTLTWNAIETVEDITVGTGGELRTFDATFYDQAGHTTSQTFSVQLACSDANESICGGNCTDLTTDGANCGSCSNACPTSVGTPVQGIQNDGSVSCIESKCVGIFKTTSDESCDAVCSALGLSCLCDADTTCQVYEGASLSCNTVPAVNEYPVCSCAS